MLQAMLYDVVFHGEFSPEYDINEAKEKLARFRPANIDQAGRISGITPADIAQLMLHIERR